MKLLLVLEGRFSRSPDGVVWSGAAFPYSFWTRYLEVFEEVVVAARVQPGKPSEGAVRSDGPGVTFFPVPYYVGPWEYLKGRLAVRDSIRTVLDSPGAVIMRVASQLANVAWPYLNGTGRPYGLEVVGDPWDVFAPGVVGHPLRPLLRQYFRWQLRRQCARAAAVAYVTQATLQERYPAKRGRTATYSSVSLSLPSEPATLRRHGNPEWRVVFVGSLEQTYKGPDVLLRALRVCRDYGLPVTLRLVGDGRHRDQMLRLACDLGIENRVKFVGTLPAGAVLGELRAADLFVLPSRTEGLPRALIEAMAHGLPCIATSVGGIPELLPPEDLVAPGDVQGLARQIVSTLSDPPRRQRMAERNRCRAADFTENVLAPRRREFYGYVGQVTEEWLAAGRAGYPQ